ncbi:unnamed protein product [Rotaria sp. Silwood1]|nr:unnamed protein product [Rotaria sp. Silwood1]CAF0941136.1 unnamed protein product [Rotaria sp. Silwood1]CAF3394168.1 unnamed protein product [Rotaria sp. Silwood1]CAF4561441.1 unnamed protein product [Rotaria sp. Silwood1]CAF4799841.1 unnamed protein product [Rotaria sp. Silwood1]
MNGIFVGLLSFFIFLNCISSSPSPIQRNADPSCPPYGCIVDTSFCFCGVTQTPDDRCCKATCTSCPPDFNVKPWLTIDWNTFNVSALDLSLFGRK